MVSSPERRGDRGDTEFTVGQKEKPPVGAGGSLKSNNV